MSAQRASQLVEAGLWLRLSGDHEGARRLFEQALKLDPSNTRARQLLESQPKPAAPAPPAAPAAPPKNPFERKDAPAGGRSGAGELDWGLATGMAPTPPPIAPVVPSKVVPSGQGRSDPFTVKIGDTTEPGVPPFMRDEVTIDDPTDPHLESHLAPSGDTLAFGSDRFGMPPPASNPPPAGTLVFGSGGKQPPAPAQPPSNNTLVFGGDRLAPPPVEPVVSSGTMVFNPKLSAPPPIEPVVSSGTMIFNAPSGSGTLVFGGDEPMSPPAAEPPGNSTLVYGGSEGGKQVPPAMEALGSGTMSFGGSRAAPPAVPPLTPYGAERSSPPVPTAPPGPSPLPPPAASSGTLQFNFDDMVGLGAPPPKRVEPPVAPEPLNVPQTAWDKSNPRIDISQIDAPGEGGGFDLISTTPPPIPPKRSPKQLRDEVQTLLSGAKDLLDLDDHTGAVELIAKALELDPQDPDALRLKDRSEKTLVTMYESKLGDLNQLPRVKLKDDEIIWLNLDHRAGFVLAQIDGNVTYEDLFAVSGMSRLDTARILAQLVEEGVITRGG
jgi:hypothetical protein